MSYVTLIGYSVVTLQLHQFIGGSRGCARCTPPPMGPILSFLHTFSPKSACFGGPHPPNGCTPPPHGKSWICHCSSLHFLAHLVYQPKSLIQSCFVHRASVTVSVHTSPCHRVRHRNFIFSIHM